MVRIIELVHPQQFAAQTGCIDNGQMPGFDPFRFVLISVAGWMNQRQLQMIEYLREENHVLREQLGSRRLRLNDDQRRRLAAQMRKESDGSFWLTLPRSSRRRHCCGGTAD